MKSLSTEQLFRKFSKMPYVLQCELWEKSFERYHALKARHGSKLNRSALMHKALLFSLEAHEAIIHLGSAKKHSKELTSLEEKFNMQVKVTSLDHKKRKITKSSKLLNHYAPLIYRLAEEEHFSFQKIKSFLAKHHCFKVDHTLIAKLYPTIKQKIEDMKASTKNANSQI